MNLVFGMPRSKASRSRDLSMWIGFSSSLSSGFSGALTALGSSIGTYWVGVRDGTKVGLEEPKQERNQKQESVLHVKVKEEKLLVEHILA